jgi:hypothetical protein
MGRHLCLDFAVFGALAGGARSGSTASQLQGLITRLAPQLSNHPRPFSRAHLHKQFQALPTRGDGFSCGLLRRTNTHTELPQLPMQFMTNSASDFFSWRRKRCTCQKKPCTNS